MKRARPESRDKTDGVIKKKKRSLTSGWEQAKKTTQWWKGTLCPKIKENAWFIKPAIELPQGYEKSKDVFMYPNNISEFMLPVKEGDTLEFMLGVRDKTRPMATKVLVSKYAPRTCKELIEYIQKLNQNLNCDYANKVLVHVLPCTAMWRFLGSPVLKNVKDDQYTSVSYITLLLNLLKLIIHHGKPYKTLLEDVLKTVTQGRMFRATYNHSLPAIIRSCNYGKDDKFYSEKQKEFLSAELVRSFCQDVICQIPSITHCLLPTVGVINEKIENVSSQNFLYALLSLSSAGKTEFISNAGTWTALPLIPTHHELAGPLVEKDENLMPVRVQKPYDDPEQYMDTYFRLLRAETFSAIQHGIKDLKASSLDLRDMNVYYNICLAGFELQNGRFHLAIHFTPAKKVKRWEVSSQLMFGNLVCISINRKFDDVIWATVSNRDASLLNKDQIIVLELLDENVKSITQIIDLLQTLRGSGVMVESPTYFHSLCPVLRSLREFDMEVFPLQAEVVYAKPTEELPGYLKKATLRTSVVCTSTTTSAAEKTQEGSSDAEINDEYSLKELVLVDQNAEPMLHVNNDCCSNTGNTGAAPQSDNPVEPMDTDWNINYWLECSQSAVDLENSSTSSASTSCEERETSAQEKRGGRMSVERFLEMFDSSSQSCLETSQCEALIHALKNKLAIIQGPPGCGKTFIGVKIVQLMLSLSPKLESPILLLTYKNHALDEFLKHMLGFCSIDDLVRIGARSKESILEPCNLRNLQDLLPYDKMTHVEIQKTRTDIASLEFKIRNISKNVEASSYLTKRSLVSELSEEQVRSLIAEAGRENPTYAIWIREHLDDVSCDHGSVKEFLRMALQKKSSNNACVVAFLKAFQQWFPGREELQRMKQFQAQFTLQIQSETICDEGASKEYEGASKEYEGGDDNDSEDEDYVKQLLETRMIAGARQVVRSSDLMFNPAKTKSNKDVLVDISDFPPDLIVSSQIRSVNNLWNLNEVQRLQFLYCILNEKKARVSQEMNDLIYQLQSLKSRKKELEMTSKVAMLSKKKIIGMTITGASIKHDLIHQIGPKIVIVEEAAEILEPSLLAALTPSIEHLILIGDHKQLRPQVDTCELRKNYHFDISMMERLIESGFPFKALAKQNRMRPEFSALLRDIYPKLEDNLPLVSKNEPLKCIEKSMFFWCHDDPEKKHRTYTNVKEAERVIALVMYLLWNDVHPSDITVLSAYLGQTKLLRKMIKEEKEKCAKFFQDDFVQVQTIDMYQGDENKYVIISLVRSNKEKRIGFLNEINRRCVAQSRAKCGMYFVGNLNMLREAKNSCWTKFISSMMRQGCVGTGFPLRCSKHETSQYKATFATGIYKVINSPTLFCKQPCGCLYRDCGTHFCRQPCFPKHLHIACPELVDDQFPECGHDVKRPCPLKITDVKCLVEVIVDLSCGHGVTKKCFQNVSDVICEIPVSKTLPRCGHMTRKPCHVKIETIKCVHRCTEMNSCGIHQCKNRCGVSHGHDNCPEKIDYKFPECGHPSFSEKKCSEEITWNCTYTVSFTGVCGHEIQKKCHQSEGEVKCPVKPCGRTRKCGHPCKNACGEDCERGECEHCQTAYQNKMIEFHKKAKERYRELEVKIKKKGILTFSRKKLRGSGPTAAEYQKVKDQVMKFIRPCHKWFPTVTKIEKVTNLELEKKFERAKSDAFGDYIDTKFHGTTNTAIQKIIKEGFKMPEANPCSPNKRGMFGQGIYFATDSSKSAQDIYTKGSQTLLLCQVILGKSKEVYRADSSLNLKKLRSSRFDSVYAPRGSAVKNDEFVIFHPDQALPRYIIHFSDNLVPPSPSAHTDQSFTVKNMKASRSVNFQDPFEMYYSIAESHFRRMAALSRTSLSQDQATISSIDIVINKDLEEKFEATKQNFRSQGIPDKEILAYHGTDKKNIESILKSNLQLSYAKRQAYGRGNYFSEFPAVSISYGDGLLLCRILPGKEYVDSTNCDIPEGYNSKKVLKSQSKGVSTAIANASGKMIIIENSDQILPFFVIHR